VTLPQRPQQRPLRQRLFDTGVRQHLVRVEPSTRSLQNRKPVFLLQRRRKRRMRRLAVLGTRWLRRTRASASSGATNRLSAEPTRAAPASFIARPREMVSSATPLARPSSRSSSGRGPTNAPSSLFLNTRYLPVRPASHRGRYNNLSSAEMMTPTCVRRAQVNQGPATLWAPGPSALSLLLPPHRGGISRSKLYALLSTAYPIGLGKVSWLSSSALG